MTRSRRPFFGAARAGEAQLKPEEYRLLRDLIGERLGIWFGPESRSSLERRLRERLAIRGLGSFADYYQLLKYSPLGAEEWEEAGDILTTHETYFFREDYQLRAFQREVLPMIAEKAPRTRRKLQVWSAGCSTGEEAYTIAMLILESGLFGPPPFGPSSALRPDHLGRGWEVRVYGSDLSKKCIAAARRGIYGPASFRATPPELRDRWFVPVSAGGTTLGDPEGESGAAGVVGSASTGAGAAALTAPAATYGVAPAVRALCHFAQMNLLDEERTHLVGRCDVIFCRNVVLYFDANARRRVIEMFYERLAPGGVLLLGHAESLLNVSTAFELLHLKEDLVYRKPAAISTS
jgi:chemotaxis protein methyltransferase CheR